MTGRDYLWCALNLVLDDEEELAGMCPVCRAEAEQERCTVCGALLEGCGSNPNFDPGRFEVLKGDGR